MQLTPTPRPMSSFMYRRPNGRSVAFAFALLCASTASFGQARVAINTTGLPAAVDALVDIQSVTSGLLIPRMTQAQRVAIAAPPAGLIVFQTDDQPGSSRGLWYYNTVAPVGWERLAAGRAWTLAGNAITNPLTEFIGTTDNQPLVVRTGNIERMRITETGQVAIGTTTPVEVLEVNGGFHQSGASVANTQGAIRYQGPYHHGNTDGSPAGWGRLENAERVLFNQNYAGTVLQCGPGEAVSTPNTTPLGGISSLAGNTAAIYPGWTATPYVRSSKIQLLYRAGELTAAGLCAGQVTRLSINSQLDNLDRFYTVQIRVWTVPAATLNVMAGYTPALETAPLVYTSPFDQFIGSGWNVYDLDTPFNWNGTDNIAVQFCFSWANLPSVPMPVFGGNAGFNSTWYSYDRISIVGCALTPTNNSVTQYTSGLSTNRPAIRFTGQALGPLPALDQADYLHYTGGMMVGATAWAAAPGNFKGPGTLHAENGVYDGNIQLSDHVFDRHFEGVVGAEDAPQAGRFEEVPLAALKDYLAEERHLPSMPSRADWEQHGPPSLGTLATGLWETVERQALHIAELEERLRSLEDEAFQEGISGEDLSELLRRIERNPYLSPEERHRMTRELTERAQRNNARNDQ